MVVTLSSAIGDFFNVGSGFMRQDNYNWLILYYKQYINKTELKCTAVGSGGSSNHITNLLYMTTTCCGHKGWQKKSSTSTYLNQQQPNYHRKSYGPPHVSILGVQKEYFRNESLQLLLVHWLHFVEITSLDLYTFKFFPRVSLLTEGGHQQYKIWMSVCTEIQSVYLIHVTMMEKIK